jgi:hypothetical protein
MPVVPVVTARLAVTVLGASDVVVKAARTTPFTSVEAARVEVPVASKVAPTNDSVSGIWANGRLEPGALRLATRTPVVAKVVPPPSSANAATGVAEMAPAAVMIACKAEIARAMPGSTAGSGVSQAALSYRSLAATAISSALKEPLCPAVHQPRRWASEKA